MGILQLAKQRRIAPSLKTPLDVLRDEGFRISEELCHHGSLLSMVFQEELLSYSELTDTERQRMEGLFASGACRGRRHDHS